MRSKLTLLFVALMSLVTGAGAAELTVYDGTATNSYVPVYGFYADAYLKAEMVMPAADLSAMNGMQIQSLTFYSNGTPESWGAANFQVFLKEVAGTTISGFSGTAGATMVYEGSLSVDGDMMTVTFDSPYTYNGGNLLIGVYNTVNGTYKSVSWKGTLVSGASVQGYSYASLDAVPPTQRDFLPSGERDA